MPYDNIYIIGGDGFIGRRLIRAFAGTAVKVRGFARDRPFVAHGKSVPPIDDESIIFYLAASATSATAERYPELAAADYKSFESVLSSLHECGGRPTVVFASTSLVYDSSSPPPYSETAATSGGTVHTATKLKMEDLLRSCEDWVRPIVLRLGTVYGPVERISPKSEIISIWLDSIARGEPVTIIGDDAVCRDFVYVDDVVNVMLRIVNSDHHDLPKVLNISSGKPTSIRRLLDDIVAVTGRKPEINRSESSRSTQSTWLAIDRAVSALDWRPQVSLQEGLARVWHELNPDAIGRAQLGGRTRNE